MDAYIINLDGADDRWAFVENSFRGLGLIRHRVPGVDGHALQLPVKECDESAYRLFHGKNVRPGEIGCYLSHLEAYKAFLASDQEHALICEDDVAFLPGVEAVLDAALQYRASWNILRVTGLSSGRSLRGPKLTGDYSLGVRLNRLKGTGAYVIDRVAASRLADGMLPMKLPFDHAFDREWIYGLRAISIEPFPATQGEGGFRSSVQRGKRQPLNFARGVRWFATYPYQAFNEVSRWVCRTWSYLGLLCVKAVG